MAINEDNFNLRNDIFIVCCSEKKENKLDALLEKHFMDESCPTNQCDELLYRNSQNLVESLFFLDFDYGLTINGKSEYKLIEREKLPNYGDCKNSIMIAQTAWQHEDEERETNGMQNLNSSIDLMMECLTCAENQNLNIQHCQCFELLYKKKTEEFWFRILSLVIKKLENKKFDRNAKILQGDYILKGENIRCA